MANVLLSTIQPDFDDLRLQLQLLLDQYPSWRDRLVSSTGQMLLDFVAGVGAYDQFSIERALQETFLDTAVTDSAVYTIARQLGVRVKRRVSARTKAILTNPTPGLAYTRPAWSTFRINERTYFNPAPIVISAAQATAEADLYEGTESEEPFVGNGAAFQILIAGSPDFSAADQFVRLTVNGVEWTKTQRGLWRAGLNAPVFYEATTQDGQVEIKFGNGYYGQIPGANSDIRVKTYKTVGADANDFTVGLEVKCSSDPALKGVTGSSVYAGEEVDSLDDYRYLVPRLYAAGDRCVTRDDWKAVILTYPGVVDCAVVGERELGPGNVAFQNVVGIALITAPTVTRDAAWLAAFYTWLEDYQIFRVKILTVPEVQINQNLHFNLIINKRFSSAEAQNAVNNAARAFFAPKIGTIGKSFYLSDLYDAIMALDEVVHVTIATPAANIAVDYKSWINAANITYGTVAY
jgi:hypothetical protein